MKKVAVVTGVTILMSLAAFAEGTDKVEENRIAGALGKNKAVACETVGAKKTDKIAVLQDKNGDLRMKSTVKGGISSTYDTDNADSMGECGSFEVTLDKEKQTVVLDQEYSDCERGNWGYKLIIPENALILIAGYPGVSFTAHAVPNVEGLVDKARTLTCELKERTN